MVSAVSQSCDALYENQYKKGNSGHVVWSLSLFCTSSRPSVSFCICGKLHQTTDIDSIGDRHRTYLHGLQIALCEGMHAGDCVCGWVGESPVDLELKADFGSCVFQSLDRKPQTDGKLGARMMRKKKVKTKRRWSDRRKKWTVKRWQEAKKMHLVFKAMRSLKQFTMSQ